MSLRAARVLLSLRHNSATAREIAAKYTEPVAADGSAVSN